LSVRLHRIDGEKFVEYREQDFTAEHQERVLHSWLEKNPDSVVEDGKLLIIGREVSTNLGSFIDLLALDRAGNVVVLELKRDRTPRNTLAQALEYASFAEGIDYKKLETILQTYIGDDTADLSEYHRLSFGLSEGEAVSFNKDQRIVIVGQSITPEIRQTSTYLRKKGLLVTCVEFGYYQTGTGEPLLSSDIVVGKEPSTGPIDSGTKPPTNREAFLKSCDPAGRAMFEAILGLSRSHNLTIHWGSMGFSLNVDFNGTHVAICKGFPPPAVFKQSLYTTFNQIAAKVQGASELLASFREMFEKTGLFVNAGKEMKYVIQKEPSDKQISELTEIFTKLATHIRELWETEQNKP
jgi:hypothetical protein